MQLIKRREWAFLAFIFAYALIPIVIGFFADPGTSRRSSNHPCKPSGSQ